ncbi:TonB-dependent receptor [bacterium]|nr:TonB-dependent receptor [bacterium]
MARVKLFIITTLAFINGFAQFDSSIDTVSVVSSTVIPQKAAETGRSITVITAEEIQALPANSIDEVLQLVTGVEVQSRGAFGVQGDIIIRGSSFNQVLVLVDGMKINDPLTGHFNSYIPVYIAQIERIEVIRGAATSLYGADAVGGVINIITKTFESTSRAEVSEISGSYSLGENELLNIQQGFTHQSGKATIAAGVRYVKSSGQMQPARQFDTSTTISSYNSYFDLRTTGISFAYRFNKKFSIHARTSMDQRAFDARFFYTGSPLDKSTETVSSWWNQVRFVYDHDKSKTDLNIAYKTGEDEFVFSPDFPSTNIHKTTYFNTILNQQWNINSDFIFKAGAQFDRRSIESNDRGNHEDLHFGVYTIAYYQLSDLNLTGSARIDYDENYGLEFNPHVSASYLKNNWVLRGSAGRGIRAADYTERYVSNNLINLTPLRNLGNPALQAESSWSEELGFDYNFNPAISASITGFSRQSTNLIDYVITNQSEIGNISETGSLVEDADYFFSKNIAEVLTYGLEVEALFQKRWDDKNALSFRVGYTFVQSDISENVQSVYLSSHARHLLSTKLIAEKGKWDVSISGLFKSRAQQNASAIAVTLNESYMLWNGRLAYEVINGFKLNLQVQNIFDVDYQNILGSAMPGRWIMAGIKYDLPN